MRLALVTVFPIATACFGQAVLKMPVVYTVPGMDSVEVLRQNIRVARSFTPMTDDEMAALCARCAAAAADGRYEPYKVSLRYDNPITRLPHGFPIDSTQREIRDMLETGTGAWGVR